MTTRQQNEGLSEIAGKPTFRIIDGVSIRFVESDPRNADALLVSPWPESVMAYEPICSRLAETTHLVAIDLPGFGRSERKDALMSPRAMGGFIVRAADAFGLEHPHIVGPDVGTSAALFAAAAQPGHFLSLVVGTRGAAVPLQLGEPLREWVFLDVEHDVPALAGCRTESEAANIAARIFRDIDWFLLKDRGDIDDALVRELRDCAALCQHEAVGKLVEWWGARNDPRTGEAGDARLAAVPHRLARDGRVIALRDIVERQLVLAQLNATLPGGVLSFPRATGIPARQLLRAARPSITGRGGREWHEGDAAVRLGHHG